MTIHPIISEAGITLGTYNDKKKIVCIHADQSIKEACSMEEAIEKIYASIENIYPSITRQNTNRGYNLN